MKCHSPCASYQNAYLRAIKYYKTTDDRDETAVHNNITIIIVERVKKKKEGKIAYLCSVWRVCVRTVCWDRARQRSGCHHSSTGSPRRRSGAAALPWYRCSDGSDGVTLCVSVPCGYAYERRQWRAARDGGGQHPNAWGAGAGHRAEQSNARIFSHHHHRPPTRTLHYLLPVDLHHIPHHFAVIINVVVSSLSRPV